MVALNTIDQSLNKCLTIQTSPEITDAFYSKRNSGLKFRKFHLPNGKVHSGCTDPTQATARLVIVLVSRIQRALLGTTILSNGKGHFGPADLKYQTGHVINRFYCT